MSKFTDWAESENYGVDHDEEVVSFNFESCAREFAARALVAGFNVEIIVDSGVWSVAEAYVARTRPGRQWESLTPELVPPKFAHFTNYFNVIVYPYRLFYSRYDRPQYRTCEFCGGDAMVLFERVSTMTGHKYTQAICSVEEWGGADPRPLFLSDEPLSYAEYEIRKKEVM